ncbi:FhaA domain-containing protein [Janibacter sp. G368]|uniref:FhaA domain-containing protein n=1 Tax=Janibacter sp. G368 TaxID=3420441 RepID=UPI003CFDD979
MSLFERMERKLERTVNGVFARAFRAEVQPLELASALRRAMDDRATMLGRGRTIVPNLFTIELAPSDYERLTEFDEELEDELVAAAQEHADSQRYQPGGPLQVLFDEDEELETGVFRVRPATARQRVERADQARVYADQQSGDDDAYDEYSGGWDLDDAHGDEEPDDHDHHAVAAAPAAAPERTVPRPPSPRREEDQPTSVHRPEPPRQAPTRSVHDRPWLEIDGERYPLISAMTVLGRDETADVVLDDPGISRRHCEVRVTHDGPHLVTHLRDLGSTNGTFVNGEPTDAVRLTDGDSITVGRTHATFHVGR